MYVVKTHLIASFISVLHFGQYVLFIFFSFWLTVPFFFVRIVKNWCWYLCMWVCIRLESGAMEGEQHGIVLACAISGTLFASLGLGSCWILWAVNWRPWRIYR